VVLATRTFWIFVSSTFRDLTHERDALQKQVFPRLANLCARHGTRFQAIGLRWGVSEEAGLDQETMAICMGEIERCQKASPRPNFIVLLGDRYGWEPLPARIPAGEFEELIAVVPHPERELLLWGDDRPPESNGWYRLDNNAVPPEYRLRPRALDAPAGASGSERQAAIEREGKAWNSVSSQMLAALRSAIDRLGWDTQDQRRIKYEASATEQEILEGALMPEMPPHSSAETRVPRFRSPMQWRLRRR
jgi:hypothetical protein